MAALPPGIPPFDLSIFDEPRQQLRSNRGNAVVEAKAAARECGFSEDVSFARSSTYWSAPVDPRMYEESVRSQIKLAKDGLSDTATPPVFSELLSRGDASKIPGFNPLEPNIDDTASSCASHQDSSATNVSGETEDKDVNVVSSEEDTKIGWSEVRKQQKLEVRNKLQFYTECERSEISVSMTELLLNVQGGMDAATALSESVVNFLPISQRAEDFSSFLGLLFEVAVDLQLIDEATEILKRFRKKVDFDGVVSQLLGYMHSKHVAAVDRKSLKLYCQLTSRLFVLAMEDKERYHQLYMHALNHLDCWLSEEQLIEGENNATVYEELCASYVMEIFNGIGDVLLQHTPHTYSMLIDKIMNNILSSTLSRPMKRSYLTILLNEAQSGRYRHKEEEDAGIPDKPADNDLLEEDTGGQEDVIPEDDTKNEEDEQKENEDLLKDDSSCPHIVYTKEFLLQMRNSPAALVPPKDLPAIPGVSLPARPRFKHKKKGHGTQSPVIDPGDLEKEEDVSSDFASACSSSSASSRSMTPTKKPTKMISLDSLDMEATTNTPERKEGDGMQENLQLSPSHETDETETHRIPAVNTSKQEKAHSSTELVAEKRHASDIVDKAVTVQNKSGSRKQKCTVIERICRFHEKQRVTLKPKEEIGSCSADENVKVAVLSEFLVKSPTQISDSVLHSSDVQTPVQRYLSTTPSPAVANAQ